MIQPFLFIAPTDSMGRGVFTDAAIAADTVIEIAPVIVMSGADRLKLDQTLLHDYILNGGLNRRSVAWLLAMCLCTIIPTHLTATMKWILMHIPLP
jgi:hypothetical protein